MEGAIIPYDLMVEILLWLPIKSLCRFTAVNKWFRSLVSDPSFVKRHFERSPKASYFLIHHTVNWNTIVSPCSLHNILKNNSSSSGRAAHYLGPGFDLLFGKHYVVNSCNGLVCMASDAYMSSAPELMHSCLFNLWNPATRKRHVISECTSVNLEDKFYVSYGFGYDNRSHTYKLVTIYGGIRRSSVVKIYTAGDNNGWRNVQGFPANLVIKVSGIYLDNTLNWIASTREDSQEVPITYDALVIVSLDLRTETCTKMLLPRVLERIPITGNVEERGIVSLEDCLSFHFQCYKEKCFVIWQMKEFGNRDSWSPLAKIDLEYLEGRPLRDLHACLFVPLCIFENGSFLVIYHTSYQSGQELIFYDLRDKEVVFRKKLCKKTYWVCCPDYVPSLISPTILQNLA